MMYIFSRHGKIQIVMSDGGTCFTSGEFQQLCKLWGFQCVRSSPHYPRSNRLAENCVKIVKIFVSKYLEQSEDLYLHRKFKLMNQMILFQRKKHYLNIPSDRERLQNA